MKVAVLLTCYNRREYTLRCIRSLEQCEGNKELEFVVADDASHDGTVEEIKKLSIVLHLLSGDGKLFWNGGMRLAMEYASRCLKDVDYIVLVNDDVEFYPGIINKLIERSVANGNAVVVGSTQDKFGKISYGGIKKKSNFFARYELINPSSQVVNCDTFNCNCVLLPMDVFEKVGNLDAAYTHSMGDFDYGMRIRRMGFSIINSAEHVGFCSDNDIKNTWRDVSLSRRKRVQLKESPKGLPQKDWFHFIKKNYGICSATYHTITPYMRIILKK